jgi:hypothetical protein
MRWAGHVACVREDRKLYRVLVGRPKENRLLGRPRRRWEDVIRKNLREIGCGIWSGFSWLRIGPVAGCFEHGDEPSVSGPTELVG